MWSADASRRIGSRIVIEGELELQTPAHLGNGDGDDLTDMPLLVAPHDAKRPLLTGASIAGAIRSALREYEHGYGQPASKESASVRLFGGLNSDPEGEQSPLVVDDAYGKEGTYGIETRDEVNISRQSRTAADKKKFDRELWQAGTIFPLRFELLICDSGDPTYPSMLKHALATALARFDDSSITIGARKRRGYGRVRPKLETWRVTTFNFTKSEGLKGLISWLAFELDDSIKTNLEASPTIEPYEKWRASLSHSSAPLLDARRYFEMRATFNLNGSLLIRSGGGKGDTGPDVEHLRARQTNASIEPILSGTSLGGVLRARAAKIANTIGKKQPDKANALINGMFGVEMKNGVEPRASRIIVEENIVERPPDSPDLVQSRVGIDRFTAGARETALFNEQPLFGDDKTNVKVNVGLRNPQCGEIGMLLLLLKDLWTGDLPLGGESSVGRGRLIGASAELTHRFDGKTLTWKLDHAGDELSITGGDQASLEMYVAALNTHLES
jgi:CRISPR/Cas system CSM-associated protein Csm3 (group 7 of RAMP superfamily)